MQRYLKNNTKGNVVISGASEGIGLALAKKFVSENYNVIIYSRNIDKLELAKQEVSDSTKLYTYVCDAKNMDEVKGFGDFVLENFDTIDILINNAGVFMPGAVLEEKEGDLELELDVNLRSAYHLTRKIVPRMKENREGYVFNICSIASETAYINGGSYCISKHALLGFGKVLREELKVHNIKVTNVMPGAVLTASWHGTDLPKDRFIQPEDIAEIVFTCSQLSSSACVEELTIRPQLGDI